MIRILVTCSILLVLIGVAGWTFTVGQPGQLVNWSKFQVQNATGNTVPEETINDARQRLQKLDARVLKCRDWSQYFGWGGLIATGVAGIVTALAAKSTPSTGSAGGAGTPRWGLVAAVLVAFGVTTQTVTTRLDAAAVADKQRADTLFIAIKKARLTGVEEKQAKLP